MPGSTNGQLYRVLLIEDDAPVRDLMRELLTEAGYHVLPTDHLLDPADVLQLRPDLILLDLVLDGERVGWDYVRLLRSQPCTARLPILVCSGDYLTVDESTGADRTSVVAMLLKPFELQYFLDTVELAIREDRTRSPTAPDARSIRRVDLGHHVQPAPSSSAPR